MAELGGPVTRTKVAGRCPACGSDGTLFVASGDHITCSLDKCPNPTFVADLLDHRPDRKVLVGRIYKQTNTTWNEWSDKPFEDVCAEVGKRREDGKVNDYPDEIVEALIVRRARVVGEVRVVVDG